MVRAIRRSRFASYLALVTLFCVATLSTSTLLHSDADDTICNPVLVVHDDAAQRIGGDLGAKPIVPEHCAICHWSSLRTVEAEVPSDVPDGEESNLFTPAVLPANSATLSRQPARAPPFA